MLAMSLDMKARLRNYSWWVSMVSIVMVIAKQCGFDLSQHIPTNYSEIIYNVFYFLSILGISVDTSTKGFSDKVISDVTVQSINAEQTKEEVKTEDSTTAINSTVTENSQDYSVEIEALKAQIASLSATNNDLTNTNSELSNQLSSVQSQLQSMQATINVNTVTV